MPRSYRHIKDYEYEIEELRKEGYTSREIGNKLGFSYKQMRNYFYRKNVTDRNLTQTQRQTTERLCCYRRIENFRTQIHPCAQGCQD